MLNKFLLLRASCIKNLKRHLVNVKMAQNVDNRLETFRKICDKIANERGYKQKSKILEDFLKKGTNLKFQGDVVLWIQLLIPGSSQRVYNLQNKQMIKLFSRLFACDQQAMQLDLEHEGDVSETLRKFFKKSKKVEPKEISTIYIQDVDDFLKKLVERTKEDEQIELFRQLCKEATDTDLKIIIRLIKQDLRINAGARHILDAFGPFAYPAYQASRDLVAVVKQFASKTNQSEIPNTKKGGKNSQKSIGNVQVMTPISPMLANACKSVEEAFKKSPSGLYSEIKYDGERVQIHKSGNDFKFFSRNLKPVMNHKIKPFEKSIPKAFPSAADMILDAEVILVNTATGELLPFGSLGAHKKNEYENATVCLFVFDCIFYNKDDLTNLHFRERRKILEENIKPIKHLIQLSESHFLKTKNELSVMTAKVLKANLEGVVLKSPTSTYQPGKRGWLKVKRDYLFGGKMADTADLVVLGGWFGSGKNGGVLSIFLMGCYDPVDRLWKTVTKVHSGLDEATNEEIHEKLIVLMDRADSNKVPSWLLCKKQLVPDYLAKCPKDMPVWEITGAEFTKSEVHTASGISIRFPRITKLRDDKSADQHNDLPYLQSLYDASKKDINVDLLLADCDDDDKVTIAVESKLNLSSSPSPSKALQLNDSKSSPSVKGKKRKSETTANDGIDDVIVQQEFKTETKEDKVLNGFRKNTGHKQMKLDFYSSKANKTVKESDLFKEFIAFFNEGIPEGNLHSQFISNGGTITLNSKDANLVFYGKDECITDFNQARMKYKVTCRHLSINWLTDSLNEKVCKPYPLYAIILKS